MKHLLRFVPVLSFLLIAGCRSTAVPDSPESAAQPESFLPMATIEIDPADVASTATRIRTQIQAAPGNGLQLHLWATEDLLEDPIALRVTDRGEVFVTSSSRSGGLLDIRGHPTWTTRALAMKSVDDHAAFLKEELAPARSSENDWLPDANGDGSRDWRDLEVHTERLYKIEDISGDGVADRAHLIVEGFNDAVTDVLGGLLIHQNDIYLSAAPDLWLLPNAAALGRADTMRSISHGYSVHPGFFGHGMSGVTMGPDGRVYWSVGDMGLHVVDDRGRTWDYPHQGAILRAFPDGSGFEVYAAGLRNAHEFAFDEFGNMISVDNDGDHPGEMERVVYIVEGSDSGWRTNWQFGKYTDPRNNNYKVWMDEELFKPRFDGQAAYILPPIANYHAGPAGMTYNPGTALNAEWQGYFFVSEYTGSPATTHVYAFRLEEEGAGFELADEKVAVSGILTVGMDFGPDGSLYLADWIDGWGSKGAGRIWRLDARDGVDASVRYATRSLLRDDLSRRTLGDLAELLGYPDKRVREKAQFELADRSAERTLLAAARQRSNRLARVHALWGMWQLALRDLDEADNLLEFLGDEDPEIRAQAARILGDVRYTEAAASLVPLLADSSARVRFFAAEALGRMSYRPGFDAIVRMLQENDGRDVYLRHAGSLALARMDDASALEGLSSHPSQAVRIAAVVALRRMGSDDVASFLQDDDEWVVTDAARAINDDGGIEGALPALADLLRTTRFDNEPLIRRAINANLRVGTAEAAQRVAAFALRSDAPPAMRVEALDVLGVWAEPSPLDRVDGAYRGDVRRDESIARTAALSIVDRLLSDSSAEVREATANLVGRLELRDQVDVLMDRLAADASAEVRGSALRALGRLASDRMEEAVRIALQDSVASVRGIAVELIPSLSFDADVTAALLAEAVERGGSEEQQAALTALGTLGSPASDSVLAAELGRLEAGDYADAATLDLLEAASGRPALSHRVEAYRTRTSAYAGLLHGGNARRGAEIFYDHDAAQCTRCHTVDGYGADVGPDLSNIGAILTREDLLEALVDPGARIAPGFGAGPSAMPPMGGVLSRIEIRDLIAFLARLEEPAD